MYEESFVVERLVERDLEIIRVQGELDIATAPQLESELGEVEGDAVIDLTECTFIDSGGIHVLVRACTRIGASVICPRQDLRRVFEIVAVERICPLYDSLEQALAATSQEKVG
jgi:anti-sigma B factor antagonist